jgi:integrase
VRNGRVVEVEDPETGKRAPKLLEASTRRIRFVNLRPFFSWWAREFDATNPFDRADVPGDDRPAPIPIVPIDDVRRLLSTCTTRTFADRRDEAIIRLLFDTGARLGEMAAMTVDDWDRRNDFLTLRGKTGTRVVPVSASSGEALSRYLRLRRDHPKAKLPALWLGPKGKLTDSGIAQVLNRRCELAGIDHINTHRLRHTWAHSFRAEGGSEGDLMYLAGWKSTTMAHRYGRSAAAERAQQTARAIGLGDRL